MKKLKKIKKKKKKIKRKVLNTQGNLFCKVCCPVQGLTAKQTLKKYTIVKNTICSRFIFFSQKFIYAETMLKQYDMHITTNNAQLGSAEENMFIDITVFLIMVCQICSKEPVLP